MLAWGSFSYYFIGNSYEIKVFRTACARGTKAVLLIVFKRESVRSILLFHKKCYAKDRTATHRRRSVSQSESKFEKYPESGFLAIDTLNPQEA